MSTPLVGNDYINRDQIEQEKNIQLPKFYDSRVVDILTRLQASLPGNESMAKAVEKSPSTSFFSSFPAINLSNIGNTQKTVYGIDNSTNTTTTIQVSSDKTTSTKKTEEEKKKEQEAADSKQRMAIAALAFALLGFASYYIGKTFGTKSSTSYQQKDLEELKGFKDKTVTQITELKSSKDYKIDSRKEGSLNKQMEKLEEIIDSDYFVTTKRNQNIDLGLRVSLFAGALITLIGTAVAAKPLMVAGGVVTGCTFCGWLIKKGIQSGEKVHFEETLQKLKDNIKLILACLNKLPTEKITKPAFFEEKQIPVGQSFPVWNPVYWSATASAPPLDPYAFPMGQPQYQGQSFQSGFPGQSSYYNYGQ